MSLKDSKWLSNATSIRNNDIKSNEFVNGNTFRAFDYHTGQNLRIYTKDFLADNKEAVYAPDSNHVDLAPIYFPNLIYNATWNVNMNGWDHDNYPVSPFSYSNEGYGTYRFVNGGELQQWELNAPSVFNFRPTKDNTWYSSMYDKYNKDRVKPRFAFRIGIKISPNIDTGYRYNSTKYDLFGLGNLRLEFVNGGGDSFGNTYLKIVGSKNTKGKQPGDSVSLYTDADNQIGGIVYPIKDYPSTKLIPLNEFYTPWAIFQPAGSSFVGIKIWASYNHDSSYNYASGSYEIFNPQLILISQDMTKDQLNALNIRTMPRYGIENSVGLSTGGYAFS